MRAKSLFISRAVCNFLFNRNKDFGLFWAGWQYWKKWCWLWVTFEVVFSCFQEHFFFINIVVSELKSCIKCFSIGKVSPTFVWKIPPSLVFCTLSTLCGHPIGLRWSITDIKWLDKNHLKCQFHKSFDLITVKENCYFYCLWNNLV